MPAQLPGLRHADRARPGHRPPLLPQPALSGARRPGVRPLRRPWRDGHRGRRLEGAFASCSRRGLVKTRGDFFRLTVEDLESLDRFARKSAENLKASIDEARVRPLFRIINGLGIPQVGVPDRGRPVDLDRAALATRRRRADGRHGRLVRPRCARAAWRVRRGASRRSPASGQQSRPASARWFSDPATADVLDDLVDAGVEPERPPASARRQSATPRGRSLARRSS